jgi:hypothetical protein
MQDQISALLADADALNAMRQEAREQYGVGMGTWPREIRDYIASEASSLVARRKALGLHSFGQE